MGIRVKLVFAYRAPSSDFLIGKVESNWSGLLGVLENLMEIGALVDTG